MKLRAKRLLFLAVAVTMLLAAAGCATSGAPPTSAVPSGAGTPAVAPPSPARAASPVAASSPTLAGTTAPSAVASPAGGASPAATSPAATSPAATSPAGAASPAATSPAATSPAATSPAATSPAATSAAAPSQQQPLTIGFSSYNASNWPLWVAKETGAFTKYGIDANLIFIEGDRAATAVVANQLQFTITPGSGILAPVSQGAPLVAIATTGNKPTDMIIGGKGITKADDLRGKVAAADELGGEADELIRYAVGQLGLTPDKDVQIVAIGGEDSTRIATLAGGQVQATIVDVSYRKQIEAQGFTVLYNFTEGNLPFLKATLVTTSPYLASNRAMAVNVVKAFTEGIAYFKTHKKESVNIAAKYTSGTDRATLETLWDAYAPVEERVPNVQPEALKTLQDFSTVPAIKQVDVSKAIDNSIVDELKSSGFVNSLYK